MVAARNEQPRFTQTFPAAMQAVMDRIASWGTAHAAIPHADYIADQAREIIRAQMPLTFEGESQRDWAGRPAPYHFAWLVGAYAQETNHIQLFYLERAGGRIHGLELGRHRFDRGDRAEEIIASDIDSMNRMFRLKDTQDTASETTDVRAANLEQRKRSGHLIFSATERAHFAILERPTFYLQSPEELTDRCLELLEIHLLKHGKTIYLKTGNSFYSHFDQVAAAPELQEATQALHTELSALVRGQGEALSARFHELLDPHAVASVTQLPQGYGLLAYNYLRSGDEALNQRRNEALSALQPWPFLQQRLLLEMEGILDGMKPFLPLAARRIDEGKPALDAIREHFADVIPPEAMTMVLQTLRGVSINDQLTIYPHEDWQKLQYLDVRTAIDNTGWLLKDASPAELPRLLARLPFWYPDETAQTTSAHAVDFHTVLQALRHAMASEFPQENDQKLAARRLLLNVTDWKREAEIIREQIPTWLQNRDSRYDSFGLHGLSRDLTHRILLPALLTRFEEMVEEFCPKPMQRHVVTILANTKTVTPLIERLEEASLPTLLEGQTLASLAAPTTLWDRDGHPKNVEQRSQLLWQAQEFPKEWDHWPALSTEILTHPETGFRLRPINDPNAYHDALDLDPFQSFGDLMITGGTHKYMGIEERQAVVIEGDGKTIALMELKLKGTRPPRFGIARIVAPGLKQAPEDAVAAGEWYLKQLNRDVPALPAQTGETGRDPSPDDLLRDKLTRMALARATLVGMDQADALEDLIGYNWKKPANREEAYRLYRQFLPPTLAEASNVATFFERNGLGAAIDALARETIHGYDLASKREKTR